jgi:hypothetical protein
MLRSLALLDALPDHNPAEVVALMRTVVLGDVFELDDETFWREARIAAAAVDYCARFAPDLPQRLARAQAMAAEAREFDVVLNPRWGHDWPFRGLALGSCDD